MKYWRLLRALILLGLLFGTSSRRAFACTGSFLTTQQIFDESSVVVRATVQKTDDSHVNGILRVSKYYKGDVRPEYIVLAEMTPPHIEMLVTGNYRGLGSCSDSFDESLGNGTTAYFLLRRLDDGSYRTTIAWESIFTFSSKDAKDSVTALTNNEFQDIELNEEEFKEFLEKLAHTSPKLPTTSTPPYPLIAPLLITTSKGTEYVLPVDGGKPAQPQIRSGDYIPNIPNYTAYRLSLSKAPACFNFDCRAYSPSGMYETYLAKDGTSDLFDTKNVRAFLWAPRGLTLALWTSDNLIIGDKSVPLSNGDLALQLAPKAIWSSDGNRFAYSDKSGLWIITFDGSQFKRRLLLPALSPKEVPFPRYFSPYGRYLAVTNGKNQLTLDLETNRRLPDGLVSPDEQRLLAFEKDGTKLRVAICELKTSDCKNLYYDEKYIDNSLMWIDSEVFLGVRCPEPDSGKTDCRVYWRYINAENQEPFQVEGYDFDYEPVSGALAVIKSKNIITIDGVELDLRQYLDGDIADIRWWPSLLYKR